MSNNSEQHHPSEDIPPQQQDTDDSSVSSTTTDETPSSVQSTPTPKSYKKKKKKSAKKPKKSSGLTAAEQDLYNSHATQIRQNAMQLLNTGVSPTCNRYRSYHDSTPADTGFVSSDSSNLGTNSLPPWSSTAQSSYDGGDISVTQVASMAFNCIAQCLTEGYRAASNYYSETQMGGSGAGYDHNYSKVDSTAGEVNGVGGSIGFQDGYQQRMDRGLSSPNQSSGQGSTEQIGQKQAGDLKVRGEYATVTMPSTYQGGNRG